MAFRKPKILGDYLVRAKVESRGPKHLLSGTENVRREDVRFVNKWMRTVISRVHRTIQDIQLITTLTVILVMFLT